MQEWNLHKSRIPWGCVMEKIKNITVLKKVKLQVCIYCCSWLSLSLPRPNSRQPLLVNPLVLCSASGVGPFFEFHKYSSQSKVGKHGRLIAHTQYQSDILWSLLVCLSPLKEKDHHIFEQKGNELVYYYDHGQNRALEKIQK